MLYILLLLIVLSASAVVVQGSGCQFHQNLRDKWKNIDESKREIVWVRKKYLFVRNEGQTRLRYRCIAKKDNVYILQTKSASWSTIGAICLGFVNIAGHSSAEYSIIRLNPRGPDYRILGPQMVKSKTKLTLDNTCTVKGGHMKQHINIKRAGNGCNFPPDLRRTWNYTYQAARYIVFSKKSASLHLLGSKDVIHFTCEGRDGNMFILRVSNATREQDGFMCWLIKKLPDDPFYNYELARLNSGTALDGKLKLVDSAHRLNFYKDCDWIESAARSEYLYE